MQCPVPRDRGHGRVPCGGCLICRKNRGKEWTARILLEQRSNPNISWFVTLTYDPENVPLTVGYDQTLKKKETTQWVQNQIKAGPSFRYYLVGEYGDVSGRPHYHMALFPDSPDFCIREWQQRWRRGFVSAYPLQGNRAAYLAKYTVKKLTSWEDSRLLPGQEPEFRTSSRTPAIGHRAWESLARAYETAEGSKILAERGDIERTCRLDGKVYPLDNYLKRKMREYLGIPLRHIDRLTHEGYYQWHQTTEPDPDPTVLRFEVQNDRQKAQINASRSQRV